MLVFTVIEDNNNFRHRLNNRGRELLDSDKDYTNKIWFLPGKIDYRSGVVGIIDSKKPSNIVLDIYVGDKFAVFEANDQDIIMLSEGKCIFVPETAKLVEEVKVSTRDIDNVYKFCEKYNFPEPISYAVYSLLMRGSSGRVGPYRDIKKNLFVKFKGPLMCMAGFLCHGHSDCLFEFSDSEIDEIYDSLSADIFFLTVALSRWDLPYTIAKLIARRIEDIPARILEQVKMYILLRELSQDRDMAVKILNKAIEWKDKDRLLEFFYKCFFELKSLNPSDIPVLLENLSHDAYISAWGKLGKYIPEESDVYKKYEKKLKKEKTKKFFSKLAKPVSGLWTNKQGRNYDSENKG